MDPLNTLKRIRNIIRNTTDSELVRLILDLQKEVFAIESHNLELVSALTSLKQQLDLPARMHTRPPSDYYFLDGDDLPFCPKCWESSGNANHLQAPVSAGGRVRRECRVCKETYWERDYQGTKPGPSRLNRKRPIHIGSFEGVRTIRDAIIDNDHELIWTHYRSHPRLLRTRSSHRHCVSVRVRRGKMSEKVRPLICQQCAHEKTNWTEHCPHATEVWKDGYNHALKEYRRPRLTSGDVRLAISELSFSWENFYHLAADALNRILDEKEKTP